MYGPLRGQILAPAESFTQGFFFALQIKTVTVSDLVGQPERHERGEETGKHLSFLI